MQPEVCGLETSNCPFSYEAVMEDAPQVQSFARLDEGWSAEAPAEAQQDAITKSVIVAAAASFLACARDDARDEGDGLTCGMSLVILLPRFP
jgi:hypothetical protein